MFRRKAVPSRLARGRPSALPGATKKPPPCQKRPRPRLPRPQVPRFSFPRRTAWDCHTECRCTPCSSLRPTPSFFPYWKNKARSEEHTSELQSRRDLVCRLLLEKKKHTKTDGGRS